MTATSSIVSETDRMLAPAAALLRALADGVAPAEAQERVAALARDGLSLELLWDELPADGSVHYDLLLRGARDAGTLSLAYCADRGLPFALRGSHRWRDRDLVRVHGVTLTVDEAMVALEVLWREARLIQRVIDSAIVKATLQRAPIDLERDEHQAAVDAFRAARGLATPEETGAWLRDRGFAPGQLLELACDDEVMRRLRARVAGDQIERRFAARPADFDRVELVWFEAPERVVRELVAAIAAGALSFHDAADQALAGRGGAIVYATVRRGELPDGFAPVFAYPCRGRWAVARVRAVHAAVLDDATREAIAAACFEDWLAAERGRADIAWNWGPG